MRTDLVDPRLSLRGIGEYVSRRDLPMLSDPAPGGQQPSQIEFGQSANASQKCVSDDKYAEYDEPQPLQAGFSAEFWDCRTLLSSCRRSHEYALVLIGPLDPIALVICRATGPQVLSG